MQGRSFLRSLFHGVVDEDLILPYPSLTDDERDNTNLIVDGVRKFCAVHVDAAAIDRDEQVPESVLSGLKDLGVFGLTVPQRYGGIGLGATAFARVAQEIGAIDASLAVTLGAHQSLAIGSLLLAGTEEQKTRFLPLLARGEKVAGFALTESAAGSDAAGIQTRAEPTDDGGFTITGAKIWTTNGGFADVFVVFARTSPPDEGHKAKLTAFLVERGPGVANGRREHKLGIRGCSTTEVFFDGVRVPRENVIGPVGEGFGIAMQVLNHGRLSLAASAVGASRRLVKLSVERVSERKAFGRVIGEFGLVKDKIATMLADTWALESMTYLTAGLADLRTDHALESAVCKIHGSETLWRTANEALQIAGGMGFMADQPYERMLRDARINTIFEGTNEVLRCFVALEGMSGPARSLDDVSRAAREPLRGLGVLGDLALRKARARLGRERLAHAHPSLAREVALFEEYTAELAKNVEKVLRRHRSQIGEMQYTQRRVADVAIDLYGLAACISRTTRAIERRGEDGARRELDLTSAFASAAAARLEANVRAFDKNDDELRKGVAARAYVDGGYPFDVLL